MEYPIVSECIGTEEGVLVLVQSGLICVHGKSSDH